MKNIYFYGNSEQGIQNKQEDSIYLNEIGDYYILMVADGNGGQSGTINTGALAIQLMANYLNKVINFNSTINDIRDSLDFGIYLASQAFLSINAISEQYRSLYASLSLCIVSKTTHKLLICSIGNTEIHLIRQGRVERINKVYSKAAEALSNGDIEERDFYIHPGRGIVTNAIGVFEDIYADILYLGELQNEDVLIMATDGAFRYLNPNQIINELVSEDTVAQGVDKILERVKAEGGEDNAAILVGHVFEQ